MSDHNMTVEWDEIGWRPTYHLGCTAPPEALCRANWECECEEVSKVGVDERGPWHELAAGYESDEDRAARLAGAPTRHYGKPGGECNDALWINNSDSPDELGRGSTSFPVDTSWDGDNYVWTVTS